MGGKAGGISPLESILLHAFYVRTADLDGYTLVRLQETPPRSLPRVLLYS